MRVEVLYALSKRSKWDYMTIVKNINSKRKKQKSTFYG